MANAIGAATARVSGVVDSVESTETKSKAQVMEELSQRAIDTAVANGALRYTVTIAEMDSYPLQYIANKSRIIIKAVGDFDYSRTDFETELPAADGNVNKSWLESEKYSTKIDECAEAATTGKSILFAKDYIADYKPKVVDRQWLLSETELEFITIGCYILGTGGGGNPYQHFLRLREMHRAGAILRVISPHDLKMPILLLVVALKALLKCLLRSRMAMSKLPSIPLRNTMFPDDEADQAAQDARVTNRALHIPQQNT